MRRSLAIAVGALAVAVLLGGCATPAALPSDPTAAELGATFGACPNGPGETFPPLEVVAGITEWVAATGLDPDQPPKIDMIDVEVQTLSGGTASVRLHSSSWPGIEWGFENDAKVWLAMADPEYWTPGTVYFVLIETADGEVFFPGWCGDETLRIPLEAELGPESDELLAGLPLVAPDDVRNYLGIVDPEPEVQDPDRLILDPEIVDASVLDPLTLIGIHLKTNGAIGGGTLTICTHIPAGWNECVMADETSSVKGWNLNAYVDDSGVLEFWLLNEDGDVSQPFGKIGEVDTGGEGIEVFVDTSTIGADGTITYDDLVTLVD